MTVTKDEALKVAKERTKEAFFNYLKALGTDQEASAELQLRMNFSAQSTAEELFTMTGKVLFI